MLRLQEELVLLAKCLRDTLHLQVRTVEDRSRFAVFIGLSGLKFEQEDCRSR